MPVSIFNSFLDFVFIYKIEENAFSHSCTKLKSNFTAFEKIDGYSIVSANNINSFFLKFSQEIHHRYQTNPFFPPFVKYDDKVY